MFTGKHAESQSSWTAFGTKESESALRSKAQKNGNPIEASRPSSRTTSCCGLP